MERTLKTAAGALAVLLCFGPFIPVTAMLNPAAVYCDSLGFKYGSESTAKGDFGYCLLPDGKKVDAWKFIGGEIAPEKSYCTQKGYKLKVVADYDVCGRRLLTDSCAVCVLPNGTEQEVTEAMGLSFQETTCGDGHCGFPEDHQSCPRDCKSGGTDEICDGVLDGYCDQDCIIQKKALKDAYCANPASTTTIKPGPLNAKTNQTTTLPATKPISQQQGPGCMPLLLGPLSLILVALAKTLGAS